MKQGEREKEEKRGEKKKREYINLESSEQHHDHETKGNQASSKEKSERSKIGN